MRVIVCIDEKNGTMFNGRRQSSDRLLIADIVSSANGAPVLISPYSLPLFEKNKTAVSVFEDPLLAAEYGDICFVEGLSLSRHSEKIEEITLYKWNRHYPSDRWLDIDLDKFTLVSSTDLVGSSHEKITKEVWKK